MRRFLFSALLLATALPAAAPAQTDDPTTVVLSAPPEVAGFVRGDSTVFPDPALGRAFRYGGEKQRFDVYIYPIGSEEPGSAPGDVLLAQTQGYLQTLPVGVERGWYRDFRIMTDEAHDVDAGGESIPGRLAAVTLLIGGGSHVSFFYVFLLEGQLVKVRTTLPLPLAAENRGTEFNAALLAALRSTATTVPAATPPPAPAAGRPIGR